MKLPIAQMLAMRPQHSYREIREWLAARGHVVSQARLWEIMREAGAPATYGKPKATKAPRGPKARHVWWLRRWRDGANMAEIARQDGVSRQAVQNAIERLVSRYGPATV